MGENDFIRCLLVGDSNVGKTSLIYSYVLNKFLVDYIPTVCDCYSVDVVVENEKRTILLTDTAGQEEYDCLRKMVYPLADAIIICFSLDCNASFQNVKSVWMEEIKHLAPTTPFILVGNKMDLRNDMDLINNNERKNFVTFKEGLKMAKQIGAEHYLECSALTQRGLKRIFDEAILLTFERRQPKKSILRKSFHKWISCFT